MLEDVTCVFDYHFVGGNCGGGGGGGDGGDGGDAGGDGFWTKKGNHVRTTPGPDHPCLSQVVVEPDLLRDADRKPNRRAAVIPRVTLQGRWRAPDVRVSGIREPTPRQRVRVSRSIN